MSPTEVLVALGEVDGTHLAARLVEEAISEKDAVDLELSLSLAFVFGVAPELLDPLCDLVVADWHHSHEDVVTLLQELDSQRAIPALLAATQWVPGYLEFDDARALAVKAIWALRFLSGDEAKAALESLLASDVPVIAENARERLKDRES